MNIGRKMVEGTHLVAARESRGFGGLGRALGAGLGGRGRKGHWQSNEALRQ